MQDHKCARFPGARSKATDVWKMFPRMTRSRIEYVEERPARVYFRVSEKPVCKTGLLIGHNCLGSRLLNPNSCVLNKTRLQLLPEGVKSINSSLRPAKDLTAGVVSVQYTFDVCKG